MTDWLLAETTFGGCNPQMKSRKLSITFVATLLYSFNYPSQKYFTIMSSHIEFTTENIIGKCKVEEVLKMIAETGMLTVGVLGLWARLVRKPLLEFTGEIIQVASGVVSRIGVSDTASYVPLSSSTNNSSLPVSRRRWYENV